MPINYIKPNIQPVDNRPAALPNKGFPYVSLDSRRFEELLYAIGDKRIKDGDWQNQFDEINLLQGVRERGRDCSLHLNGKSIGLIQCKHSIDSNSRISMPECAREIIKFVLHYLKDNRLIDDPHKFIYFFAVSFGFTEGAQNLLDNFNNEIIKQSELQNWTETVIKANEELKNFKYDEIETDLKNVLQSITIKKLLPQDLDLFLNTDGVQSIIKTFFEVKLVVESEPVERLTEEIKKQGEYQFHSNLPIDTILQQFNLASHHLKDWTSTFEGIEDSHIERKETDDLIQWVKSPLRNNEQPVILLVGPAGSGKTVILKDTLSKIQDANIPVIGMKADRYYAESIVDLQNKIDLGDSFEKIVRSLIQTNERVVVLIDQLDALSQSLSAKREYLDTYNLLVRKLILIEKVRIIISVRSYDLDYDNELRFYKDQKSIKVGLLNPEEVIQILSKLGIREVEVPKDLLELLRIPHHLNVFCKIYSSSTNLQSIKTLHDLYEQLWKLRIINPPNRSPVNSEKSQDFVFIVATQMYSQQKISISSQPFLMSNANEIEYLKSCGILHETNNQLQFFHQTFFDYAFAKQFVKHGKPITKYLIENHQGLFIRSSLKMIVSFLREQNHIDYIKSIETILFSKKYRFHIKLMLLNLIGFEETPTNEERDLVRLKVLKNQELKQPFIESINSSSWFNYLTELKEIDKLFINTENWHDRLFKINWIPKKASTLIQRFLKYENLEKRKEENINLSFQVLIKQLPKNRKKVSEFLLDCPDFDGKDRFIFRLLYHVKEWDFLEGFQLFEKYESRAKNDRFGYYKILEEAAKFDIEWVIKKYQSYCIERINLSNPAEMPDFDYHDEELFKELFLIDVPKTLEFALDIIKRISDSKSGSDKSKLYIDFGFWMFDNEDEYPSYSHGYKAIYAETIKQLQNQATQRTPLFNQFYNDYLDNNSITMLRLLFFGLSANVKDYATEILELMKVFHKKNGFESDGKIQHQFRSLLKSTYQFFDTHQKDEIDEILLSITSEMELETYTDDKGQKRTRLCLYGKHKFLYLSAIPREELMNRPGLKKTFLELERKFKFIEDREPNKLRTYGVGAPMEDFAYEKMNLEQWEISFERYKNDYEPDFASTKGGILEHSRAFEHHVTNRPDYFFPLIEKLIEEKSVENTYIIAGLNGLKEAKFNVEELKRLYKNASKIPFERNHTLYFVWITSYFIQNKSIDLDILKYLIEIVETHPDPQSNKIKNNALMDGANNVRGAAAARIVEIYFNPDFEDLIFDTLNRVAEDSNISVRVSVIARLAMLMNLNEDKTLQIFLKLVNTEDVEIIENSVWTVQYLIDNHFDSLQEYFKKAIEIESLQDQVSVLLGLAWLKDKNGSENLLKLLLKKSDDAKAKLVDMAIKNLSAEKESVRKKCKYIFLSFLNSNSKKVIHEYSTSFLDLTPEMFLEVYPLMEKYAYSNVAKKSPHYYFEYLIQNTKKHPLECLKLLKSVILYEKPDITSGNYIEDEPIKVLIGIYNSLNSLTTKDKKKLEECMSLFDKMLKSSVLRGAANKAMDKADL